MTTTPAPRDLTGFHRTAMGLAHGQPVVLAAGIITQTVAAVTHLPAWTAISVVVTITVGVTIGELWCPHCHHGDTDEDDTDTTPQPTPEPVAEKTPR